jgi:hypothetical protein
MIGQHQIPQEISSYEFRLVGNMTVRQFIKMGAGLLAAAFIYISGMPFLLKFLLITLFSAFGFALAFIPVNDRPLDRWIASFFKSIYSPTIYIWKKTAVRLDMRSVAAQAHHAPVARKVSVDDKQPTIKEYVASLPIDEDEPEKRKTLSEKEFREQFEKVQLREKSVREEKQADEKVPVAQEVKTKDSLSMDQLMGLWDEDSPGSKQAKEAEFLEAKMPATPTTPNLVSGLVIDEDDNEVEGAIVEIQDIAGNPVRAMRTNGLGQFQTATPLSPGDYLIVVEKEPYRFDIIKLAIEGKIVSPLKIKAHRSLAN